MIKLFIIHENCFYDLQNLSPWEPIFSNSNSILTLSSPLTVKKKTRILSCVFYCRHDLCTRERSDLRESHRVHERWVLQVHRVHASGSYEEKLRPQLPVWSAD